MVRLTVHNRSQRRRLYRSDDLRRLAARVCDGEGFTEDAEVTVVLCDDAFIAELNRTYRKKNEPTDVVSFGYESVPTIARRPALQKPAAILGDIVISLETVEQRCGGDRAAMRDEVRLLFCHGLLHLLGLDHGSPAQCRRMAAKQAEYLGWSMDAAWKGSLT